MHLVIQPVWHVLFQIRILCDPCTLLTHCIFDWMLKASQSSMHDKLKITYFCLTQPELLAVNH